MFGFWANFFTFLPRFPWIFLAQIFFYESTTHIIFNIRIMKHKKKWSSKAKRWPYFFCGTQKYAYFRQKWPKILFFAWNLSPSWESTSDRKNVTRFFKIAAFLWQLWIFSRSGNNQLPIEWSVAYRKWKQYWLKICRICKEISRKQSSLGLLQFPFILYESFYESTV